MQLHTIINAALVVAHAQRPAVREGIVFLARTIVQRTQPGQRQSVKTAEHQCHVYVKADSNLAGIVLADDKVRWCNAGLARCSAWTPRDLCKHQPYHRHFA